MDSDLEIFKKTNRIKKNDTLWLLKKVKPDKDSIRKKIQAIILEEHICKNLHNEISPHTY